MTKLEEKLIELGYKDINLTHRSFKKCLNENVIFIEIKNNKIIDYFIEVGYLIVCNEDITDLKKTYLEFQKDLEVLKEYEKSNVK